MAILPGTRIRDRDILRFCSKFPIGGSDCWEWQAGLFDNGYGQFWYNGQSVGAHRISYQLFKGDLIDDLVVMHSCDNKKCVNPNHLEQGTYSNNNYDSVDRGRWKRNWTHCKRGHEFSEENIKWRTVKVKGKEYTVKFCIICKKEKDKENYLKRKVN